MSSVGFHVVWYRMEKRQQVSKLNISHNFRSRLTIYVQEPGQLSRVGTSHSSSSRISRHTWSPAGSQRPSSLITPSLADSALQNKLLQEARNQETSSTYSSTIPGSSRASTYELDAGRPPVESSAEPVRQRAGAPGSPQTVRSQGTPTSPGSPTLVNVDYVSKYIDTPESEDHVQSPYSPPIPPRSPSRVPGSQNAPGLRGGSPEHGRTKSLPGLEGQRHSPDLSQNEDHNLQQNQYISSLEERIKNIELQLSKATHQQRIEPEDVQCSRPAVRSGLLPSAPPLPQQAEDTSARKFLELENTLKQLELTVAAASQQKSHSPWGYLATGQNYL